MAILVGMDRPNPGGSDRRYVGFVADLAEAEVASAHE